MIDLFIISPRPNLSIFFMFHHLLPHSYFLLKVDFWGPKMVFFCYDNFQVFCHPGTDSNAIIVVSIFRQLLVLFFTFKGVLISLSSVCSCQSHLKTEQCLFFFPIINKSLQASLKPKKNKDHLDSVF